MDVRIEQSWKSQLAAEWDKQYFINLTSFVREQYSTRTVFPPASKIFAAFDACPFDTVKVIILGQDPYHDVGQANGLCFSVSPGIPMPRRWSISSGRYTTTPAQKSLLTEILAVGPNKVSCY